MVPVAKKPIQRVTLDQLITFCPLCANSGKRIIRKNGKDVMIDCDHDGMILIADENDPRQ